MKSKYDTFTARKTKHDHSVRPSASPPSVRDFDLHRKHDLKCSLLFAAWNRIVPNCRLTARQQARPRTTPSLPLRPLAVKVRMNVNPSQKPSWILCTLEAKIGLSSFWRAHKTFRLSEDSRQLFLAYQYDSTLIQFCEKLPIRVTSTRAIYKYRVEQKKSC